MVEEGKGEGGGGGRRCNTDGRVPKINSRQSSDDKLAASQGRLVSIVYQLLITGCGQTPAERAEAMASGKRFSTKNMES